MSAAPNVLMGGSVTITDASPTFELTGVQKVSLPGEKAEFTDTTTIQSPGGVKEYVPSLRDSGDVSISCIYENDTTQQTLRGYFEDGSKHTFAVSDANAVWTATFDAFVESWELSADMAKATELTLKLKRTGVTTYS